MRDWDFGDWVLSTCCALFGLAAIILLIAVIVSVSGSDHGYIQRGKVISKDENSITLQWCDPHAKVSDHLINTTIYQVQSGDVVEVRRRDEWVGRC